VVLNEPFALNSLSPLPAVGLTDFVEGAALYTFKGGEMREIK